MQRLLNIQSFLHVTFVVGLIVYATGFALGSQSVRKELEARVILQEVVDSFLQKEGRSPKNIEELTKLYPRSTLAIENLDGEKVVLESTGARSYKLTFAGWDKLLRTDDEVVTQETSLRRIYERLLEQTKHTKD